MTAYRFTARSTDDRRETVTDTPRVYTVRDLQAAVAREAAHTARRDGRYGTRRNGAERMAE